MSAGDGIRVLHVDDDTAFADMTATHLEREGDLTVVTTTDATDALERLDGVDCVVSDYDMPGIDGIELLESVRERRPELPFVLFTSEGSEAVASEAIAAGVSSYLRKEPGGDQFALLANRVREHVSKHRAQARAERQARISGVVREINRRLVLADSRSEIEQGVCDVIADSESYLFAWIGREDDSGEVIPSAQAGVPFDLDRLTVTSGEDPYGQGPVGRAVRSREIEVVQDTDELPLEEWRTLADEWGVGSLAVVPLVHDGRVFGILDVYAPRRGAFDDTERSLLAELGDTIAHAIDAVETTEELRAVRNELRRKSSLLDTIFESVPAHLYVKDRDARTVRVSDYYADPGEHVGKTDLELYDEALASETYADDLQVIETGDPIINKEEYQPGGEWVLTSKVPWREDGEIRGLIGITRRITERKEYEHALERQNERLEEVLDVISHDLRNPLGVATGQVALAAEECDSDALPTTKRALDRMDELIDDALALARGGRRVESPEPVRLRALARRSWSMVPTDDAELRVEAGARFEADPGRLRNLFENLFRNAAEHAAADGGTTTVRVGALAEGFYVADDGPGIPPAERDQVFDPGYSTDGDGTGFGLAIVRRIVDAHGWEIDVAESESGGARFEVTGVDVGKPG